MSCWFDLWGEGSTDTNLITHVFDVKHTVLKQPHTYISQVAHLLLHLSKTGLCGDYVVSDRTLQQEGHCLNPWPF